MSTARGRADRHLGGLTYWSSSVGASLDGSARSAAAARFLASFLACFRWRRSRSLRSRLSFAIVVFLLPLEAMPVLLFVAFPARAGRCEKPRSRSASRSPRRPVAGAAQQRQQARARASVGGRDRRALQRLDVPCRRPLGALLGVVAHLRALSQRLEAAALDRAVVHEQVLAGVIRRNESETLVIVEPLHGSCCHLCPLRGMCTAKRGGC